MKNLQSCQDNWTQIVPSRLLARANAIQNCNEKFKGWIICNEESIGLVTGTRGIQYVVKRKILETPLFLHSSIQALEFSYMFGLKLACFRRTTWVLQRAVLLRSRVLRPAEATALCQPPGLQGLGLRQLLLPAQGQLDGAEHVLQRGPQPVGHHCC